MARNAEKAMTALARFRQAQLEEGKVKERRPFLASGCTELPKAEKWRRQIIGEISKKVAQIQNAGLGEFRIRDLNNEINKLLREKRHWEVRFKELGGPDYGKVGPKMLDHEVGTRLPSSLDPNEEERVQGALLIQKAWMLAWLVHAEPTAETARDWPVQARGHPFQVQLSSSVRFLRPTVTRVLCASATGRVHSSREGEPLSEDIALLLLAESHQWQPPRPGTPFSGPRPGSPFRVPQWDDDILSQWGKSLPHRPGTPFRGHRPGTPFSVSQGIDDSAPQWETYLTSTKLPRDFAPPGVLRLARHKFRCQKPYKDKTAKIPYAVTADSLRNLRALIKTTSSKKTLGPLKELKEIKEGQVLLPPEVPDCRSNPLSREPRPSVLPPATRKRGASTSVHRPRKVQRSLDMSTVFEEPMDFDHSGTRVSATSPRHYAWDASEKVNEDDRVPGPSSADSSTDQRGLRTPELSTSREVGQRLILSHKRKFKPNPDTKMGNGYSHYGKKKRTDPLSEQGHLPNLPEDEEDSSPEQGVLEHVLPAQGSLETSCSPGVPLQKPLLSLERPLDLSIPTQGNAGTSQSAQGLQRFLPSTHKYLENSPSAFEPLEHLPVAPKARGLSTLSQETPSPLLPVHGTLELPQYGSEAIPSMPSVQGLQGSLSPLERSIAPVLSVHGSLGHSLSAQDPTETYKSTKATPGQSLSSLDDMSPFMSSQETLGPLSSVEVDVGTYSHNTGSPGQLKNISGFPGSMISDHDPVLISLPAQGTLRHLPSAKEDVGLSLSTQQAPELSTLEQGSIQHVEASKVALVNPSSPKRATGKLQCGQYALEHLPPSEGALQHSSTHQGTQESLKSSLESLEILSSNSEHVKNSLSATGGLESSLSGSRVLGYELADKHPEQHSIYSEQGSLGNPLSTQEVQEHLVPLKGNLKSCQSAKEGQKTLIPSQIVLESVPSISEDLEALSSALERMRISPLANESLENSQYAESVVESSSSATGTLRTTFAQKSLENSLPGKGMREILSSSQGALEISSTKGRVENVSSLERSMKPPTSLQEPSRPYSLIQGTHQHPLPTQGPLGPVQTDSGIHGPFLTPEAGGNLSREPGSCKSFPLTPETLDHLQSAEGPDDLSISAHEMFDPFPPTQGTLGILVYSSGLMEPSESEHRKLGHVSSVGKDGEISPFEKPTKSTSPLPPYLPFNREVLESSSCGLGALGSLLSAREDAKDTASAPHAQEPSLSTSQALEHFVTTQGPLQINTPNKQTLCSLTSRVEDVEHSIFSSEVRKESQMLPNVLDPLSNRGESQEFSFSAPGTKNISLLAPETLEHSSLENATQATSHCPQEVVGSLLSVQGSLGQSPSDHGSLGPLASTLGAGRPSLSEADTIQLSASAPVTKAHLTPSLGPSASKYHDQMEVGILPALHGDLEASQSDQRTVEMTKIAEGALENVSVAQRTTKLSTCSQEANKSSLSDQGHLLHSAHVKEALIPALSDQETKESLLSPSKDTEHPPSSVSVQMQESSLSTLGPQDSLLTPPKPWKLSISVSDSLCPLTSSQESGTETVALSTLSPEYLEPIQSAQGELEYFSTIEQGNEHSSTASQTTRKLFSPQECGGHLSSDPSVQEPFQSGPMDVATLLSSQGPQKPFKLTEALLYPSTSGQECQEHSESSQDVMGTHESSESIHGYILPEVEPVVTFTAVSGTTVTSPSAPQPLELSSLLHVTSATSLTDQRVVGPRPPSQRTLEVLSLAQGTLEPLASPQGNERNSQLEKDTVEQSFSLQGILGSSPRLLQSTLTPGLSSLTQESSVPSPSLQKDDEFCLSSQATLEMNTSGQDTLNPSPTTQVPEKASLYTKPSLAKPTQAQGTEGHPASKLGTIQSTQKELGFSPHAQKPLIISLSTQGTLGSCSPDQGDLGTSLSVQGSLKLSTPTQGIVETVPSVQSTLTHPTSSQVDPRFSPLAQHTVQDSASSPRTTGLFQSSQKPQGSFLSSPEHIEHLPSAASAQENLLSNPWTLGPLLSSKVPKELSTATEESLPVPSSLSSSQQSSKHSVYSSKVLRQHQYSQNTLGHLSCGREGMESSQSATRSIEALPPPLVPRGHLTSIKGSEESFPAGQGNLDPHKPSQGPLEHVTSPQEMLHSAQFAEGTLQVSAHSKAVPEPHTNSQFTQVTRGTFPSVPGHLGLLSSTQTTPPSSCSDVTTVRNCPSSEKTLKMSKSTQGALESSSASQGTGEFLLSAKGTMGNSTSAKQSVGPFPSTTEPLRSIQNTQTLLGSLQSGQSSLGVSRTAEGPVDSSLFPQGSLDLSVSAQGTLATLLCNQGTRKHPASSQTPQNTSQSVQNSLQYPPSVPGSLKPSQSEKSTLESLSSPAGIGLSSPGSQEMFQLSASSGHPEPLLYSGLPLELSMCAQGTLCPFSSPQGELDPLHCFSGNLESSQPAQMNVSHLSSVREPVGNSPSVPGPREPSPFTQVPRRLSSHVPGDPASLISDHLPLELNVSAQCSLSPSSKGTPGSLLSSANIQGKVQNTQSHHGQLSHIRETSGTSPSHVRSLVHEPCPQETLGLYSLGQGSQATSQCAQGTVGSCLSPQESMGLSTSAQRSLGHPPPAQGLSGTSSHTQHTCSQSTSAQSTAAYSSPTQYLSQHAKKTVETLKSDPGFPIISITAQASVEPLLTPQESPKYSSSIPGVCKTSTATRGHVVSDDGPLELSISAQANLSPFHSSQCLLKPSLSIEGTFGLSTPLHGTLGPSVSSLGHLGSWQSAQSVQQTNPSASDSLGSMPSSKGQTVISLSGQGTLSTFLEPLKISLSVQVSSRPSLSLQEPGGSCLSSHGENTLEVSTCAHSNLVLSNSSRGDLGSSSSTPVTLGSSPPAKVDLGKSPSVSWTLTPPVSAQGVQGTSTSAQEVRKPSLDSQGRPEPLPSAQDDLGLGSLSLGTEGNSQFSKEEFKVLPSAQGGFKPALSTPGSVEKLLSASRTQRLCNSTLQDAGSFSLSSKNNSELSISSKKHLASSPATKTSLKHSPSSQESWGPTPSTSDTLEHSLQDQGWQKPSVPTNVTLGQTPHQKGYEGNSLSVQGTVKLSISGQESLGPCSFDQGSPKSSISSHKVQDPSYNQGSVAQFPSVPGARVFRRFIIHARGSGNSISAQDFVGHSKSDQESPEMFTSSQENPGPSLFQEALVHSSSLPQDFGISQSSKDMLGTSLSTQGARRTPSSVQGSIVTVPLAQSVLEFQTSLEQTLGTSQFASETTKPLTSSEEVYSILKSLSRSIEILTSILETLTFSTFAKGAASPSKTDQVILRSPRVSHKPLEFSPSDQQSVKTASSQMGPDRTSLTDKGLQEISSGEKVLLGDLPLQQICSGNALSTHGALGRSISAQEALGYPPSAHGSPDTSLTPEEASGTWPLETPPSTHHTLEVPSSTHGIIETSPPAQDSLGHLPPSVQILQQVPLMPETSEPLSSTKETFNISDSSPGTSETFPSIPGSLEISFSAQSSMGPSVSEKEIIGSSVSLEESLGHSFPDKGSLRSTPPASGTGSLSPSEQGCQEISSCGQGNSPSQQCYTGNPLHSQEALCLSISAQESLEYSPFAQGPPDTFLSSQEASGPSLDFVSLGHSPSDLGMLGRSDSDDRTLENPPFTQSILEIQFSNNGVTETSKTSQDSLRHLPPSVQNLQPSIIPETSEPLPPAKEVCKTSKSVLGALESLPSFIEALRHLNSDQCTLGPSVYDQGNLEPSTPLHSTIGNPKPSQSVLEPISSTQIEHEDCKLHSLSKIESKHSSSKRDEKPKATHHECIEPSISKGGFRSSRSHEKGGKSSASPQASHKCSRSIKTKLEQAPSNKAEVHAFHTEHEDCKHLSLSQRGFSHASSAKRDKKPDTTPQQSIEASTSTEEDIATTPSHEETLRHSTSPHGTSSLTSTSPRTRLRHFPYTEEVIKTSTEAQESFRSSPDGDSPRGSVKSSSLSQSNDVRHPVSTKEDVKHTLSIQEGHKPSTVAREGSGTWIPVRWGLMYPPIPKRKGASFPVVQGNFRHTRPQLADLRSSLSYQGRDTAFQYGCQTKSTLYHQWTDMQVSDEELEDDKAVPGMCSIV
ncbi:hypothetical protein ACRRTK_025051 [Alexandromys fortis]